MSGSFGVYLTRKWLILLVKEYMLIKMNVFTDFGEACN